MNTEHQTQSTVVRMPPSPTGKAHLGTARVMLINYIFAKSTGGEFIYRSEDTDLERSTRENEQSIIDSLTWLQIPVMSECMQFIRQTECTDVYDKYLTQLHHSGHIFACFTTPEEVEALKEKAAQEKTNFVFWSKYRDMPLSEQLERINKGETFVYRIRCPKDQDISWNDAIKGSITVNSNTLGDFAVARSDNSVLYILSNVIDDWTQGVTHIIRGEDHVANTPKQILCYHALQADIPIIAHLPNIMDHTGKKLSKRRAPEGMAIMVDDFRTLGFIPEGVNNGLLFLGWNPKNNQEIFSVQEVEKIFHLGQIQRGNAQYDYDKMLWFNHQWLHKIDDDTLMKYYSQWREWNQMTPVEPTSRAKKALRLATEKHKIFSTMQDDLLYTISNEVSITQEQLLSAGKGVDIKTAQNILIGALHTLENWPTEEIDGSTLKEEIINNIHSLELKTGVYMPVFRVAMTGRTPSVGPIEVAAVIGRTESIRRIKAALALLD